MKKGFRRKHPVIARLLLYSTALLVGLPIAFCNVLTRGIRVPTHGPPPGYKELRLQSEGLRLRAWLRTGSPVRPPVVLVHGLGDSIESYLHIAKPLADSGHTVLLPELRAHGDSEGRITTLGGREREDVRAALDYLQSHGLAADGVILMGWSMGAMAAIRAAVGRKDVRAVILEAPFDSYRASVTHHAWLLFRIPRWAPIIPTTVAFAGVWGGFDPDDVDAVRAARALDVPLMVIVDGDDPRMPEEVGRRIIDAHRGPHELWIAPKVPHVGASLRSDYWPHVLGFLERQGL